MIQLRFTCGLLLALLFGRDASLFAADVVFSPGKSAVVVESGSPDSVRFAAEEATNFLSRVLGRTVPVLSEPEDGRACLVLGTNRWSRAAGIRVEGLPRDSFVLRADGNRVYAVGHDDGYSLHNLLRRPPSNAGRRIEEHPRATLFAVYEFLERFAGCRFYFPGECGEIAPRRAEVRVPAGTDLSVSPQFTVRSVTITDRDAIAPQLLNWFRLRFQTDRIPCCHGLNSLHLAARFAKDRPEFFCLGKDGRRGLNLTAKGPHDHSVGQLCHTSEVWDEITADVLAYFRGESAASRGLRSWGKNLYRGYADVMPQDGMRMCFCENCQAAYDLKSRNWADALIWGRTIALANRLTAERLPGTVVQMAYTPYAEPPQADIPTNVMVMAAVGGPWAYVLKGEAERQAAHVRRWHEKLGRKVWLWTYPAKCNLLDVPDAPQMAPHAWGAYVRKVSPDVFGMYNESPSDRFIFNYLNFYVFSRQCWDPETDVAAILAEHHRLMFGAGAGPMSDLYDLLERTWIKKVAITSVTRETDAPGVRRLPPDEFDLLMHVYSPELIARADGLIASALAAVPKGSPEARRIDFMRRELYGPIRTRATAYQAARNVKREIVRRKGARLTRLDFAGRWSGGAKGTPSTAPDGSSAVTAELTSGGKLTVPLAKAGVSVRPGARYRVTFFMKTDLAVAAGQREKHAGALLEFCEDRARRHFVQTAKLKGTHDWTAWTLVCETTAGAVAAEAALIVRAHGVSGRLELGGLAIEEISDSETQDKGETT